LGLTPPPSRLSNNQIQVGKSEIRDLIPHSGAMCLLDAVLQWDDESVVCVSDTHRDPANPLRRDGRLSALHAFEYGAQAAAIHGGLRARAAGTTAPPGYLAALRNAQLFVERLDDITQPLKVRAQRLFGEAADTVYACEISAGDKMLARGRVTIMLRQL
jgi:predicted hotdog family 3-hydroxylacyl-ACP dehydratase